MIARRGLLKGVKTAMEFGRRSSTLGGKVAIVTASTEGIGFAVARRLGQDGAKVVVSSRKQNNVDEAVKTLKSEGLQVSGIVCHVGKDEDRKRLINKTLDDYGKIDIVVSNAAVNPAFNGPIIDVSEEAWDKIFDINVKSTFLLLKEVVPHMMKQKNGAITIVSSIAGYAPFQALGAYSVSKTALFGLTKAMANELASSGIRVNCIAPGLIKTKFSSIIWTNEALKDLVIMQQTPLHRIATPDECAGTVSFLSSDDASYVTGETIVIAGGRQSRL